MLYAGKIGSEEYNMVHAETVLLKYASQYIVGTFKE